MTELQLGKYEFYQYEDNEVLKRLKKSELDDNEDFESLKE